MASTRREEFQRRGWVRLPWARDVAEWAVRARQAGLCVVADPDHADWLRCGGTWFAGVNALPNDAAGGLEGPGAMPRSVRDALAELSLLHNGWDRAQVSVVYPGYPKPSLGESDAAFRFRRDRDAAHVDGLLPVGDARRRMLREPHGFVLGLPLTECSAEASPMVVWEGSHKVIRAALGAVLSRHDPRRWADVDLTDAYQAARRRCFETCARVPVVARPGEAYLVHRLALHGVAPWGAGAVAPPEGRMIAYFRPELPGGSVDWVRLD